MGLSSFILKGFCYWCSWYSSVCEGGSSFCRVFNLIKFWGFLFMFLTGFTSFGVLLLFHFVYHLLLLHPQIVRSQSNPWLMYFSLKCHRVYLSDFISFYHIWHFSVENQSSYFFVFMLNFFSGIYFLLLIKVRKSVIRKHPHA